MRELQRKQRIRGTVYSIPSLIILSIITFFLVKGALEVMGKERESLGYSKDLERKAAVLVLREQELKENIHRLQTEEGIKGEIKERFNVTQAGEYIAVVVDDPRAASSTDDRASPWYKRLWSAIIGSK